MKLKKEQVNEWLDNPKRLLIGGAVVGIGGFFLFKLGKKFITDIRSQNTGKMADDNPEVRQALAMRSAMNPSGASWMMSFDTTNTQAVFDTARQITKMDNVISAYKRLYDDDLLKDLQRELNTEDYQKFLTMVSSNPAKAGGNTAIFAAKSQLVVALAEVFLRSSPDASYHGAIYEVGENKNIIRKAKVGEFLGYATGKQSFDEKNNVKFIEVAYLVKKENLPSAMKPYAGKTFRYWVSSSNKYIALFTYFKDMFEKYPSTQAEASYKKPLTYYSALKGIFSQPVMTIRKTKILDDKMHPLFLVEAHTLLGEYLMCLDTIKDKYIKFRTVDNTERWVNRNDVILKN